MPEDEPSQPRQSQQPPQPPQAPQQPVVYTQRTTGWDILIRWRRAFLVLAAASVALIYVHYEGTEGIVSVLQEIWPVLLAPLLGWYFGKWTVANLYRPAGRIILTLDVESHSIRFIYVPEAVFTQLSQSGNNVVFHSSGGVPVYIAQDIDLQSGEVHYGWIHENNALEVLCFEDAWVKWHETLDEVLRENLELSHFPMTLGLGFARDATRNNLDEIAKVVGLQETDYEDHSMIRQEPGGPEGQVSTEVPRE